MWHPYRKACTGGLRSAIFFCFLLLGSTTVQGLREAPGCARGRDCENTKCLTNNGLTTCCQCSAWDVTGRCRSGGWRTASGELDCSFDVDMYEMSLMANDGREVSGCPPGLICEDLKCTGGDCCKCFAWERNGRCRQNAWTRPNGGPCGPDGEPLTAISAPSSSSEGCPVGAVCEASKCRMHNGEETCCTCTKWKPNGQCYDDGWVKEGGIGECTFPVHMTEQLQTEDPEISEEFLVEGEVIREAPSAGNAQPANGTTTQETNNATRPDKPVARVPPPTSLSPSRPVRTQPVRVQPVRVQPVRVQPVPSKPVQAAPPRRQISIPVRVEGNVEKAGNFDCPIGVPCEATKCRTLNGVQTCCECFSWQSNGLCRDTGWAVQFGGSSCDFVVR